MELKSDANNGVFKECYETTRSRSLDKDMNLGKLWKTERDGGPGVLQSMGSQRFGHDLATEQHNRESRRSLKDCRIPGGKGHCKSWRRPLIIR